MKILLSLCFFVTMLSSQVEFYGKSYVVYDRMMQTVLEGSQQDHIQSVASISKIMTAILVIENMDLDTVVTVDETINKAYGSCVYIHIKDKISIRDLLYGLMLRSGNDCALMLARACSKQVETFVEAMNQKANELNLVNTHFSNPSGLDEEDEGNTSTVLDMAILMDYCCQNPIFNQIVGSETYQREDGNGTWHNKNRLLKEYDYCVGGKTGYTKKARRTLITRAKKENMDLIIVTFQCGNDFEFHRDKYEAIFQDYQQYKIFDQGIFFYDQNKYFLDEDIYLYVPSHQVNYLIENDYILVHVNHKLIYKKKLQVYRFDVGFKYILKELCYG